MRDVFFMIVIRIDEGDWICRYEQVAIEGE